MKTSTEPLTAIVGPFSRRVQHILDRIEKRREIAGESQDSTLCIGGPGNFNITSQPGVQIDWDADDDEKEELPRYTELEAVVREIRVTNPTDEDMWVDLLARNASLIKDDVGKQFWIDWLQDLSQQPKAS